MERVWLLFHDVNSAMKLYTALKAEGLKLSIAPTPREASKCCGVCILLEDPQDAAKAEAIAQQEEIELRGIHKMEAQFNPNRDKYC